LKSLILWPAAPGARGNRAARTEAFRRCTDIAEPNSLKQAVHEASESDIRALLVRAEGPNFSQGGDVLDFLEKSANQFRTFIAECNQSFRAIERSEFSSGTKLLRRSNFDSV
jgi:hypothetical protein